VIWLGDRDGVRTPSSGPRTQRRLFQANPGGLYLPPSQDSVYGYQPSNVEAQRTPRVAAQLHRVMLTVRRRHVRLRSRVIRGTRRIDPVGAGVFCASTRRWRHRAVRQQPVAVPPAHRVESAAWSGHTPIELTGQVGVPPHRPSALSADTAGERVYWFQLSPAEETS